MKITIIGTGYVGLVTGACLADLGNTVTCVDIDEKKIINLKKGIIPIYEPELKELVQKNFKAKRLHFSTEAASVITSAEVVFSAVGTPPDKDSHADLTYVKEVARIFGKSINRYTVFVNKSTIPVGTTSLCKKIIETELKKRHKTFSFGIISNPEFCVKEVLFRTR